MVKIFNTEQVTIIRKRGDFYFNEAINTRRVLTGTDVNDETVRRNVIRRLRKDPSNIFVLEGQDGLCEEKAALKDGLTMALSIDATDWFRGAVAVSCNGDEVYKDTVIPENDTEEAEFGAWNTFLSKVTYLLNRIEEGDYSFIPEDDPHFVIEEQDETGDPVNIYVAKSILEEDGYETESVHVVGFVHNPILFVDENEVVMLGSKHFGGDEFFLEMKRLFFANSRKEVEDALQKVDDGCGAIEVIAWEDGSWSFRGVMDDDLDTDNFLDRLHSDLSQIREFIGKVEDILGEEVWPIMNEQRQLFIYEGIAESLKLSKLKI